MLLLSFYYEMFLAQGHSAMTFVPTLTTRSQRIPDCHSSDEYFINRFSDQNVHAKYNINQTPTKLEDKEKARFNCNLIGKGRLFVGNKMINR